MAITAEAPQGLQARCQVSGMDSYLSKPFDTERLRRKIQHWADPDRCKCVKRAPVLNPDALEKLKKKGQGLLQEAARILRSLQSASEFLGAEKLADLCAEMERLAGQGDADRLEELLLEMERQFSQVAAALHEEQ